MANVSVADAGIRINTWLKRMNLFGLIQFSNKSFLLIVAALSILSLAACSRISDGKEHRNHVISELLDSAEAVMNDNPELALQYIDSIDSHSIRGRERQARYALLCSEVLYKNSIDVDTDSLIMIAVRYYSVGNHTEQLFRSFYCLGCIYNELGQLTDAAVALGQAELLADKINDGYRLGLLFTQLGNVFFNSFDFYRAEQYYRLAMDNYAKAGKDVHRMHALYDISGCLIQQKQFESAHSILKEVKEWAAVNGEHELESSCMLSRLICSIYLKDINMATTEHNEYMNSFGPPDDNPYVFSVFATYYLSTGEYVDAAYYINKGWDFAKTKNDSINLWYEESLSDELRGIPDSALVKYKHSIELQNQNLYNLLDQPILGAQKDYYRNLAETESLRASRNRLVAVFLTIVMILVLTLLYIMNRVQKERYEQEKQEHLLTVTLLHTINQTQEKRHEQEKQEQLQTINSLHTINQTQRIRHEQEKQEQLNTITSLHIINQAQKEKHEKEKQDYLLAIKELRQKEDTNNVIISQLNRKVNTLFGRQYAELDRIFDKMMELEENEKLSSIIRKTEAKDKSKDDKHPEKADILYSHIKNKMEELGQKKNQKKIDAIIDNTLDNLMERIKDKRFKMTDEEINILRFSLIGYSVRTINKITGLTPKCIYQKRDRAIKRIGRFSPEIQNELHNLLK